MRNFGLCETETHAPRIVCKEEKSSIYFVNGGKRPIRHIRVDGCAIKDGIRCDYLIVDHNNREHFIELKGSAVKHAFRQLEATIKRLSADPRRGAKHAYVICNRNPLRGTETQIAKLKFRKEHNAALHVEKPGYEVVLD